MTTITYIEPAGQRVDVDVPDGWSLMQAAITNGVDGIVGECGGSCACATCHCYVESHGEGIPAPAENELSMLENVVAERKTNSRLTCQIEVTDDLDGIEIQVADNGS